MSLQGQLSKGGLVNLLQYLNMNGSTGCLVIRQHQGARGYIFFDEGKLVHAGLGTPGHAGVRVDIDALSVLINFGAGRFQFQEGLTAPIKSLNLQLELIILEASRKLDEASKEGRFLLHEDSVLLARPLYKDPKHVTLSIGAIQLLGFLNGLDSLQDLSFKKNMRLEEVLDAAEELLLAEVADLSAIAVESAFIFDLRKLLVDYMGPVGDLLVEDALLDLNSTADSLPQRLVTELIEELRAEVESDGRKSWFQPETRKLCSKHGITVFA